MELQKVYKKSKRRKNILWAVPVVGLIIGSFYFYHYSPQACAYRYAFAYNKNDFEEVFSFYNEEAMTNKFTKEEIIEVLEEQSKKGNKIKPKELTMIKDEKAKKWFVKFPYSLQKIYVYTPTGSTVYVDNKKIIQGVTGQGIEVKDMLPGKHQITIQYYDHLYPDFTTEIDVPEEITVKSPYDTLDIAVMAPTGTWVTMGDITKQNRGQKVSFDNMLPGQYDISVFMGNKDMEIFSQKIQIGKQNPIIYIENIVGNENVKKNLQVFFKEFNIEYKVGIMKKDTTFLHTFLTDKINEDIISDFKMWYIDHKDIKDAKSLMEVRDIYPISGNELKASVLETVYLTNLEKDGAGKDIERQYRVVIEWNYKLLRNNAKWQIISREIRQSMVAYKDEEKWIKY
ncbi:MAG TPA: hypothetical protein GX707_09660 [Epulopiscium sp.]|nr:hypothetical protein [Candidatus Epulonipiscium sp.]